MNIQIIKNQIICNPTSLHDIETLSHMSELSDEYTDITIDLIDLEAIEENNNNTTCGAALVGFALNAKSKGKKVVILTVGNQYKEASKHIEVVKVNA